VDVSSEPDGYYEYYWYCYDEVPLMTNSSIYNFTLDRGPPIAEMVFPWAANESYWAVDFNVSYWAYDNFSIDTVELYCQNDSNGGGFLGSSWNDVYLAEAIKPALNGTVNNFTYTDDASPTEYDIRCYARANDSAGHWSDNSSYAMFRWDNSQMPSIILTQPDLRVIDYFPYNHYVFDITLSDAHQVYYNVSVQNGSCASVSDMGNQSIYYGNFSLTDAWHANETEYFTSDVDFTGSISRLYNVCVFSADGAGGSSFVTDQIQNEAPICSPYHNATLYTNTTDYGFCNCTDPEGDALANYSGWWFVNGVATSYFVVSGGGGGEPTNFDHTFFAKNDTILVSCTANDGLGNGIYANSSNTTVSNTAPEASAVTVLPVASVYTDTNANCSYSYYDVDSDLETEALTVVNWYVNGTFIWAGTGPSDSASNTFAGTSNFSKHDNISCESCPYDSGFNATSGACVMSANETVLNTVPTAPAYVNYVDGTYTKVFTCGGSTDIDGDTLTYDIDVYYSTDGVAPKAWENKEALGDGYYEWDVTGVPNQGGVQVRCRAHDGEAYGSYLTNGTAFLVDHVPTPTPTPDSGYVSGTVHNPDGTLCSNCNVLASSFYIAELNYWSNFRQVGTTDSGGFFNVSVPLDTKVKLVITAPGDESVYWEDYIEISWSDAGYCNYNDIYLADGKVRGIFKFNVKGNDGTQPCVGCTLMFYRMTAKSTTPTSPVHVQNLYEWLNGYNNVDNDPTHWEVCSTNGNVRLSDMSGWAVGVTTESSGLRKVDFSLPKTDSAGNIICNLEDGDYFVISTTQPSYFLTRLRNAGINGISIPWQWISGSGPISWEYPNCEKMPGEDACALAMIRDGGGGELTLDWARYTGMTLGKDYIIGEDVWDQFGGSAQFAVNNPQGVFNLIGLDFRNTAKYAGFTATAVQEGDYMAAISNGGLTAGYAVAEFYDSDLKTTGDEPRLEVTADLVKSFGSIIHWAIEWPLWLLGFVLDLVWGLVKAVVFLAAGLLMIALFVQLATAIATMFGLVTPQ
jgi:hypothetical protein